MITQKEFNEWVETLDGYPNNKEARLALNTLKVCVVNNRIDDSYKDSADGEDKYKVTENGYAMFDYTMFCYFLFRPYLCSKFPRSFVESYDAYIQKLMAFCFDYFFSTPKDLTVRLICNRAESYDKIVAENDEDSFAHLLEELMIFMAKDFYKDPESKALPILDIFSQFYLQTKVSSYTANVIVPALKKEADVILGAHQTIKHNETVNAAVDSVRSSMYSAQNTVPKATINKAPVQEEDKAERRDGIIAIIIGIVLIALQIMSYIGNFISGNPVSFFGNVTNINKFLTELMYFFGYNFFGLIGIFLVISGLKLTKGSPKSKAVKNNVKNSTKKSNFSKINLRFSIVLTSISLVLFAACMIGGSICETIMENAGRHYEETIIRTSESNYVIGCGYTTCPYCTGRKHAHTLTWSEWGTEHRFETSKTFYRKFYFYELIYDINKIIVPCTKLFLIIFPICVIYCIISFISRYKFTITLK